MPRPLWTPSPQIVEHANMTRFLEHVRQRGEPQVKDYPQLYRWSIAHPKRFWPQVWTFCGIKASKTWDQVLVNDDKMPSANWFTGARLNFAENLLR